MIEAIFARLIALCVHAATFGVIWLVCQWLFQSSWRDLLLFYLAVNLVLHDALDVRRGMDDWERHRAWERKRADRARVP